MFNGLMCKSICLSINVTYVVVSDVKSEAIDTNQLVALMVAKVILTTIGGKSVTEMSYYISTPTMSK